MRAVVARPFGVVVVFFWGLNGVGSTLGFREQQSGEKMSDDSLQLSGDLIQRLQDLLTEADPRAGEPIVAVQYLAAVTGFLVAQMSEPVAQRKEYLEQLAQFTHSVFLDVESRKQAKRPSQAPQEASGVWKPGDP